MSRLMTVKALMQRLRYGSRPDFTRRRDGTKRATLLVRVEIDERNWQQIIDGAKAMKLTPRKYLEYLADQGISAGLEWSEES